MKKFMFLLFAFVSSSCSLILPYEEEPLCKIGREGGYCGSIMDVYEATLNAEPERRKPVLLKPGRPCHNCTVENYDKEETRNSKSSFPYSYVP